MSQRALFQILLRFSGVMLVVIGSAMAAQQVVTIVAMLSFRNPAAATVPPIQWVWYATGLVSPAMLIAAGVYLSSGGRYVLILLFPTNATTCESCGYSLQSLVTDRCPECGCEVARGKASTLDGSDREQPLR